MFCRLTLLFQGNRRFTLYVAGERVEIVGTIDSHSARFGSARWTGSALEACTAPLRPELLAVFTEALRAHAAAQRATAADRRVAV